MQWAELTGDQFAEAVAQSGGVCLVPLSVLERHGHHLPLATDMYIARELCRRAATREPAMEFPDYIFTQIPEARHLAGTISIDGDVMLRLLDNICREIARNGLKKIVLVNAHGGNHGLLSLFNMLQLAGPRDYVVYLVQPVEMMFGGTLETPWEPTSDGHAGPGETSMILALRPDLVDMGRIPADDEGQARNRLQALREAGVQTGIWWYADHPTHYQGDARLATRDAAEQLLETMADAIARAVRAIKADDVTPRLQDAFHRAAAAPGSLIPDGD
jgi:creatinine amidohydrolase